MANFDLGNYNDVAERLRELYAKHPNARVVTEIQEFSETRVTVRAAVYRDAGDAEPAGVDFSSLAIPGSTPYTRGSELENASTSATGRAIVLAGLPSKRVASADEVRAHRTEGTDNTQIAQAAARIFSEPEQGAQPATQAPQQAGELGDCPEHRKPFRVGKFGPHCASKLPDGTWCKRKPSLARVGVPAPAPAQADDDSLERLPF
jgi:hypothetical protein